MSLIDDLDLDLDDFELTFDDAPEKPTRGRGAAGRPGKWDRLILALDAKTTKTQKTKKDDQFLPPGIEVGPWLFYPKSKEPEVGVQVQYNLANKWGKDSEFHQANGYYFQAIVAGRVARQKDGAKNPTHYGYLAVRKVIEAPDGTQGTETDEAE